MNSGYEHGRSPIPSTQSYPRSIGPPSRKLYADSRGGDSECACGFWHVKKACHFERAKRVEKSRRGRCRCDVRTARPLGFARGDSEKTPARNSWHTRKRHTCHIGTRRGMLKPAECQSDSDSRSPGRCGKLYCVQKNRPWRGRRRYLRSGGPFWHRLCYNHILKGARVCPQSTYASGGHQTFLAWLGIQRTDVKGDTRLCRQK
jgi:hypothetical protein